MSNVRQERTVFNWQDYIEEEVGVKTPGVEIFLVFAACLFAAVLSVALEGILYGIDAPEEVIHG